MPGARSSRSTLSWTALSALAALALAVGCGGGQQTTGVRPTGSGGGSGNGSGGSGNGTGSGGSGALTDGGPVDQLPPFDGGVCTDNDGHDPSASAVTGTFSGMATGAVCSGGAFAYVQSMPADDGGAPTILFRIDTTPTGDPAARIRFQSPANALDGGLSVYIGLPAASPGTYGQDTTCGSAVLFADLPGVDPSACATDAGYGCPNGCQLTGSLPQVCTPAPTETDYAALATSDCHGYSTPAAGSWSVTLTSLTSEPDAGTGIVGDLVYKVHGTLTATLANQASDAGTATVTLSLSF